MSRVTNTKRNQVTSVDLLEKEANQSDFTSSTKPLHNEEVVKSIPERDINTYIQFLIENNILLLLFAFSLLIRTINISIQATNKSTKFGKIS